MRRGAGGACSGQGRHADGLTPSRRIGFVLTGRWFPRLRYACHHATVTLELHPPPQPFRSGLPSSRIRDFDHPSRFATTCLARAGSRPRLGSRCAPCLLIGTGNAHGDSSEVYIRGRPCENRGQDCLSLASRPALCKSFSSSAWHDRGPDRPDRIPAAWIAGSAQPSQCCCFRASSGFCQRASRRVPKEEGRVGERFLISLHSPFCGRPEAAVPVKTGLARFAPRRRRVSNCKQYDGATAARQISVAGQPSSLPKRLSFFTLRAVSVLWLPIKARGLRRQPPVDPDVVGYIIGQDNTSASSPEIFLGDGTDRSGNTAVAAAIRWVALLQMEEVNPMLRPAFAI